MLDTVRHFARWSVGRAQAETQTTPEERSCLAMHVRGRKSVVEIGSWHGVTTARLRRAMDPEGTLYAVDPYYPGRLGFSMQRVIARREVAKVGGARVVWVRTTGAEAVHTVREDVDFIFIDGDHSYEGLRADWTAWRGRVTRGGIVALHDSTAVVASAGSAKYTAEVIVHDPEFEKIEEVNALTVMRKR